MRSDEGDEMHDYIDPPKASGRDRRGATYDGSAFRAWRMALGITVEEMATATGTSPRTIINWCNRTMTEDEARRFIGAANRHYGMRRVMVEEGLKLLRDYEAARAFDRIVDGAL